MFGERIHEEPNAAIRLNLSISGLVICVVVTLGGIATLIFSAYCALKNQYPGYAMHEMGLIGVGGGVVALISQHFLTDLLRNAAFMIRGNKPADTLHRWEFDYPWDRAGEFGRNEYFAQYGNLIALTLLALLLGVYSARIFTVKTPVLLHSSVTGLLDLACGIALVFTLMKIVSLSNKGPVTLEFARFPFFIGEDMDVRINLPEELKDYQSVELTLRCVRVDIEYQWEDVVKESMVDQDKTYRKRERVAKEVCNQLYAATKLLQNHELQKMQELNVSFPIPLNVGKETDLTAEFPVYWELMVRSKTPEIGFIEIYLLPVYDSFRKPKT